MKTSAHRISRRLFLGGTVATLAAPAILRRTARAAEDELRFLVIGDWGASGSRAQRSVAAAMSQAARQIGPRFVISVGDNFYRGGVASVADPQWQSSFETIYSDPALRCPWYVVLGNHDHLGNVAAERDYAAIDPRWHLPAPYYRDAERLADGSDAEFFFLDTTTIVGYHSIPAGDLAQIAWLERALAASRARWKIVIGHHPVFSGGMHGGEPALKAVLPPLFRRYGVAAYLNGHDHDLEDVRVDGTHYITCGTGSRARPAQQTDGSLFVRADLGFLAASLTPAAMNVRFVDAVGKDLYAVHIPASA